MHLRARPRSWLDRLTMGGALVAISAPVYWLGLVALYLFADDIGMIHDLRRAAAATCRSTEDPLAWFDVADPAVVRAGRVVRGVLRAAAALEPDRDACREDYIRTARAKGLRERARDHAPRRAQRGHAGRHGPRASTSASCSAARS